LPPAKPPTDLPPSKVFHGIGVASLHLTLMDARDDVHFLFKSSPFGSQSHGHNPQNSFQLNAYGEALLTTCVYRDLHGSKFHYQWAHSTVAHNAVLVNGQGQEPRRAAPQGRIIAEQLGRHFDYVCGDATAAYGGRLLRALRHVAFVKGEQPFIVLYDELVAKEPCTFQFMLHALREFTVEEKAARLSVEQRRAGVTVQYLSPVPLKFRQWDGYTPPPRRPFPNQWHVEASTQEKRPEIGMITVIVPYRAGQRRNWTAERLEDASVIAVRVNCGRTSSLLTFRKQGSGVRVEAAR
ncbi:MAG: heparinase II/III-family protein, partial [Verrucomicrobiae bacterium]|nr:heparinase II/III-family protein [Verrucomicrobiae bacterium]